MLVFTLHTSLAKEVLWPDCHNLHTDVSMLQRRTLTYGEHWTWGASPLSLSLTTVYIHLSYFILWNSHGHSRGNGMDM